MQFLMGEILGRYKSVSTKKLQKAAAKRNNKSLLLRAEPYLWILPSIILMAIFIVVPIGFVFRMAFS